MSEGITFCACLSVEREQLPETTSPLQPIESGIDIPDCWVPEHDHTRLMRDMLIWTGTPCPLTSQSAEGHHKKAPQPFHLQTAHKMSLWNHLLLDRLQLLEVCNYLGLFLRKHVHQSSQRVFFTKAVKSPHSAFPTHLHYAHPGSLNQGRSTKARMATPGSCNRVLMTGLRLLSQVFQHLLEGGRILPMTMPKKNSAEKVCHML